MEKHVFKVLQRMPINRISGAVHKSKDIRNMMLGRHIIYCPNTYMHAHVLINYDYDRKCLETDYMLGELKKAQDKTLFLHSKQSSHVLKIFKPQICK